LGNNAHPQFIYGPLMLAAPIGVMRIIQARQADGHRFPGFDADFFLVKPRHRGFDVNDIPGHGWRRGSKESSFQKVTGEAQYAEYNRGK
jgi:hypothetical protein